MNDDLLEFCIYNIMRELKLRNLDTSIEINKIIEYIQYIIDKDDILNESYEDDSEEYEIDDEEEVDDDELEEDNILAYDEEDSDEEYEEYESYEDIELWKNEEEEITEEFIRNKIKKFVNLNNDYFSVDSNSIVLDRNLSLEEIESIVNEINSDIPFVYIEFILTNIKLLKIIGIEVRTDIAEFLVSSEEELGQFYFGEKNSLLNSSGNKKFISKLKIAFMKNILGYFNTINNLSHAECLDLIYVIENLLEIDCEEYPLHNNTLMKYTTSIPKTPFLTAIFLSEGTLAMSLVIYKIIQKKQVVLHNIYNEYDDQDEMEKIMTSEKDFYLAFLSFLDEEIETIKKEEREDEEFISNLVTIKYYLMMALDSVYGTNLFLNPNNYDFNFSSADGDYVTYIFIDDLLEYMDIECQDEYGGKVGIVNRLNNLLKKIFIKTDYFLTKDETIIEHIYNNSNYGKNDYSISTNMLNEIISLKKVNRKDIARRIKRKEDN